MPSAALMSWQNDYTPRLDALLANCGHIQALVPPNSLFLDDSIRGFVLQLSSHFQGYCRNLYIECFQLCIAAMPSHLKPTAEAQFFAQLSLDRGNPSYENIKRDFNRFGFLLDMKSADPANARRMSDLRNLVAWRNKAAHQSLRPLGGGVPTALTISLVRGWQSSCDGLSASLDNVLRSELHRILGTTPW